MTDDVLITPRPKSSKGLAIPLSLIVSERFIPRNSLSLGMIESASEANASGALNSAPRMKPTVRFPVRKDATMPIAIIVTPTNQYPM